MLEKSFLILKSNLTASDIKQLTSQWDLDSAIFANLFRQLDHINQKLNAVKRKIDYLDSVARETTKTKELKKVTDLTRELVYLKHTLDDQTESLRSFGEYLKKNQLASSADIASLMTKQAQLTKMIHVYTDLLNSISGLFTAMMDSHLNHLMKYLNSVALISGIWGMNIGGLPGRTNKNGFWIIITIAAILTIIWAIILKKKKYND
nr:CorA family divalent cation transporter [Lactobacillus gallinarum]